MLTSYLCLPLCPLSTQLQDRRFDDVWPVWDVEGEDGDDIRCNRYKDGADNDRPAAEVRKVTAGEDITLRWSVHEKFPPSHMGPVIT